MFKRGWFREYLKKKLLTEEEKKLLVKGEEYYGVLIYHESEPEIYIKTNILGEAEIVIPGKNSRLEKATEEEVNKALTNLKGIGKNSEDLENRV